MPSGRHDSRTFSVGGDGVLAVVAGLASSALGNRVASAIHANTRIIVVAVCAKNSSRSGIGSETARIEEAWEGRGGGELRIRFHKLRVNASWIRRGGVRNPEAVICSHLFSGQRIISRKTKACVQVRMALR